MMPRTMFWSMQTFCERQISETFSLCVCVFMHEQTFFLLFSSAHFIARELQSGYSIILALYVC